MNSDRLTLALRGLIALGLAAALLVLGTAVQRTPEHLSGAVAQNAMASRPYLDPGFRALCERVRAAVPPDAKLWLQISRAQADGLSPDARWQLRFNVLLWPLEIYTARPELAATTAQQWGQWVEHQCPGALSGAAVPRVDRPEEEQLARELGIDWKLCYPQTRGFKSTDLELLRRTPSGWQRVELPRSGAAALEPFDPLHSSLAALALVLSAWALGQLVGALLQPARAISRLEQHARALAIGLALHAAFPPAWCALSAGRLSYTVGLVWLAWPILPGLWCAWRARALPRPPCERVRWSPWQRIALGAAGLAAAFALLSCLSVPQYGFDATFHFSYKAQLLLHEGLATPGWTNTSGPLGRMATHPGYPPGVGAWVALCSSVFGAFDPSAGRVLVGALYLLGAALLWCVLRPRALWAALIGLLGWCATPLFFFDWGHVVPPSAGELLAQLCGPALPKALGLALERAPSSTDLLDGQGDLALAVFALASLVYLARAARLCLDAQRADRADLAAAGAGLAGLLLIKNEGALLALCLGLACGALAWISAGRGQRMASLRALALCAGLALALALPWLAVRGAIPDIDENYPQLLRPANIAAQLGRIGEVWTVCSRSFFHPWRWNFAWPLFLAALLTLVLGRRRAGLDADAAALVALAAIAGYALVLLVTSWDLEVLAGTRIPDRLYVHVLPLAWWFIAAVAFSRPREPGAAAATTARER